MADFWKTPRNRAGSLLTTTSREFWTLNSNMALFFDYFQYFSQNQPFLGKWQIFGKLQLTELGAWLDLVVDTFGR